MTSVLIRNVAVGRQCSVDVLVGTRTVLEIGRGLAAGPGGQVIDGAGGALIPGLHDHHVHLRAVVAARQSVDVSGVASPAEFDRIVSAAAVRADGGRWVRVIGWHEPAAGPLDRQRLDALAGPVPVRVQHRSGAVWVLNSTALEAVGAAGCDLPRIERDEHGMPTGRLFRLDDWLRDRLGPASAPISFAHGLARYAAECTRLGITGWTDATPDQGQSDIEEFSRLANHGVFAQRLVLMAPAGRTPPGQDWVTLGPVKVLLDDAAPPAVGELADRINSAHRAGSAVAVHCVTAEQLVITVAAFELAGTLDGAAGTDRIEHAGTVPSGYAKRLAGLGLAVVTQPGFIGARGDTYRREVPPVEQDWLYPAASLLRIGVAVAAGTDAPFGPMDPWQCMASAINRLTPDGAVLGRAERVPASRALQMFLAVPHNVRKTRIVAPRQPADLCLLHAPLREALASPSASTVHATIIGGNVHYN